MKKKYLFGFASLGVSLSYIMMAQAEPIDDARYIVDASLSEEYLSSVMDAMAKIMAACITGEMAKNGVMLSEEASATIVKLMKPSLIQGMRDGLRDDLVDVHLDLISPESLAAYRAFLETPAGAEIMSALPELTMVSSQIGEQLGFELGMAAADDMVIRIRAGDFPDGTSKATQEELIAVIDQ